MEILVSDLKKAIEDLPHIEKAEHPDRYLQYRYLQFLDVSEGVYFPLRFKKVKWGFTNEWALVTPKNRERVEDEVGAGLKKEDVRLRSIEEVTESELFDITDIATGGWFKSKFCSERMEMETGSNRRLVSWMKENERNFFEVSGGMRGRGWNWYSWCIDNRGQRHNSNCLNAPAIVDYCREREIDIDNNHLDISEVLKRDAKETAMKFGGAVCP